MNFSINSMNTPSFKGIYVVEGTGKEIREFSDMVRDLKKLDQKTPIKGEEAITDLELYHPTRLSGDKQPCAEVLVTTNEDTASLRNWFRKYRPFSSDQELLFNELSKGKASTVENMIYILAAKRTILADKKGKYLETINNPDKEIDFVLNTKKESGSMLEQMKEFTTKKIETFKFADVMKGFIDGTFSIAHGKFRR